MSQEMQDRARQIVADFMTEVSQPFPVEDTFVVWFSKTLQNWKAIVGVKDPYETGFLFEVTHNGDAGETYLDAYYKFQNRAIPDPPEEQDPQPEQG